MKKFFLSMASASMIVLACLFAVCVTSCGDDDDNDSPQIPQKGKATETSSQGYVYVSESVLKFYDVKLTDAKGNTTTLTLENTKAVESYEGYSVKLSQGVLVFGASTHKQQVRYYTTDKQTFTSFPSPELNYTVVATPNGQTPGESDKVWPLLIVDAAIANNNPDGNAFSGSSSSAISNPGAIPASNWEKYIAQYPQLTAKAVVKFQDAETLANYSIQ